MREWARIFAVSIVVFWGASQLIVGVVMPSLSAALRVSLIAVGLCAVFIATDRDTYLPYLGRAALPASVLKEKQGPRQEQKQKQKQERHKTRQIKVEIDGLPPNGVLVWWSYGEEGTASIDSDGRVSFRMDCPKRYWVPGFLGSRRILPAHVHYRFSERDGMLSSVRTRSCAGPCQSTHA